MKTMKAMKALVALLLIVAACGDDGASLDASLDGGELDAAPTDAGGELDAGDTDAGDPDAGDPDAGRPYTQIGTFPFEFRIDGTTVSEDGSQFATGVIRPIGGPVDSLVDLSLYSDDETEVTIEPRRVRFSNRDSDPVFLVIRGVDDDLVDGPQEVTLSFVSNSANDLYAGGIDAVTTITNLDDERALEDVSDVDVGTDHVCAVSGGQVLCWGEGARGQLGAELASTVSPRAVSDIDDAVEVALGDRATCVRRAPAADMPGTVACWGAGTEGQLGRGAMDDSATPEPVTGITDAVAIDAGPSFACAVHATGAVSCWGANAVGQLGDGSTTPSDSPRTVMGIDDAIDVELGGSGACALRAAGGVRCWGDNTFGQVNASSGSGPVTMATNVAGISRVVSLSATNDSFCALRDDDAIRCWGNNDLNQLGERSGVPSSVHGEPVTPVFDRPGDVQRLAGGANHHCVTTNENRLICWGSTNEALIGNGPTVYFGLDLWQRDARSYASVAATPDQLVGGGEFVCARTAGRVHCMGPPSATLLAADGWVNRSDVETPVLGVAPHALLDLKELVATPRTTCALSGTHNSRCWGGALVQSEYAGAQGHGGTVAWTVPGPLVALEDGMAPDTPYSLRAGTLGMVGRVSGNQRVFYWGAMGPDVLTSGDDINYGGLGSDSGINGADGAVITTLGAHHTCWTRFMQSPRCYGDDAYGQRGDDAAFDSPRPTGQGAEIVGVSFPEMMSAGADHTCAVQDSNGVLKCWGRNHLGQLGDGTTENRAVAITPSVGSGELDVLECGGNATCIVRAGTMECVGDLGEGAQTAWQTFGVDGVDAVELSQDDEESAGCAVAGGTMHCWGVAGGTWASPVAIGEGVEFVAVGRRHVCWATQTELRCRGASADGMLGGYDLLGLRLAGAPE